MKRLTPVFFVLVLMVALAPAAADEPQLAEPMVVQTLEQNATSMFTDPDAQEPTFLAPDVEELGWCKATATCANGSTVSCTTTSGSCWWIDHCYAVCGSTYKWCSYRPHPCPI